MPLELVFDVCTMIHAGKIAFSELAKLARQPYAPALSIMCKAMQLLQKDQHESCRLVVWHGLILSRALMDL